MSALGRLATFEQPAAGAMFADTSGVAAVRNRQRLVAGTLLGDARG
jgi:hypothetical protein